MGWNAPTAPKHVDLGEIPGLRELSDEEREKLEKSDPNDGLHAIKKNLKIRKEKVAEKLLEDFDQAAMDIGNFIDNWLEEPHDGSPDFNVLSPTLYEEIKEQLAITNDFYDPDDVYEITLRRELHPMMFYYGVNLDPTTGKPYIVITNKPQWDEDSTVDVTDLSKFVAPDFLTHVSGSTFALAEDMSPSKARREMIKQAFVEKHEVAGL